jgi:DNA-binding transcriptional LysR family regulator
VLPPILSDFLRDRPGLRVTLSSRNSGLLIDRVASQDVDLGLGMVMSERPGVGFEKLCSMQAVCVLHPSHPLAGRPAVNARDLQGERFIALVDEDRAQLAIDSAFSQQAARRTIVLRVQLTEACCSFVAAGAGVSIVDPLSTVGFRSDELVVRPFRPAVRQDIYAITPIFRPPSLAAAALIAHVRTRLRETVRRLAETTCASRLP